MATTTTNFGWDIPQSTDLVKDGATAIAALGQDIDTAFVDFKGGTTGQVLKKTSGTDLDVEWGTASSGLTLINTTSFSAVASQSINDVFSSTYKNYLLVSNLTTSANTSLSMRFRVSGADNSTANYNVGYRYNRANVTPGVGDATSGNQTQFNLHIANLNRAANMNMLISNPQVSQVTTMSFNNMMADNGATDFYSFAGGALFNATTSFTGFTIYTSGVPTMTGSIEIYGVNN